MELLEDQYTEYYQIDPKNPSQEALNRAAEMVKAGGIIAYPTDTLYGLGVNIKNPIALEKLYAIKGRKKDQPVSVLINNIFQAEDLVGEITGEERRLFSTLLPGKLTLLIPVKKKVDIKGFTRLKKIGFRIPKNVICYMIVDKINSPISTTSVNLSNKKNIQSAKEIQKIFNNKIDLILDAGPVKSTKGSSVIDLSTSPPTLVRIGDISQHEIEKKIGYKIYSKYPEKYTIIFVCSGNICRSPMAEGILKKAISRTKYKNIVDICSAGILNLDAANASTLSIKTAQEYDVDLSNHLSQHLSDEMIRESGLILCLALDHYSYIVSRYPNFKHKVVLLKQWQIRRKLINPSVADPIGQGSDFFQRTFTEIHDELMRILPYIVQNLKEFVEDFNIKV